MIEALELTNFKCFAKQRIDLGAVTLLAGQNGMGKSTVLQSLLLLRQSDALVEAIKQEALKREAAEQMRTNISPFHESLVLNGRYLSCGTVQDVLHEGATEDRVHLQVRWDNNHFIKVDFDATVRTGDTMRALSISWHGLLGRPFVGFMPYLAAERVGPRMSHAVSSYHVDNLLEVGHDGAYTVAFLEDHARHLVLPALCRPEAPALTLAEQVTAWMTEISPGIRLHTQRVPEVNAAALGVSFSAGRATSARFRPTSVGFGVSYALPVVVTLLAALPDSLVLIENPEAHLHPRGQMALGELIARAGAAGVQVIVETHSDHVVNGVRLAVKEQKIRADRVKIHYFTRRDEGDRLTHEVVSPRIDSNGRLDQWPEGFFDQWDLALERLL
jgi:predicted ATPase